jgi:hypothetical protein
MMQELILRLGSYQKYTVCGLTCSVWSSSQQMFTTRIMLAKMFRTGSFPHELVVLVTTRLESKKNDKYSVPHRLSHGTRSTLEKSTTEYMRRAECTTSRPDTLVHTP